MNFKPYFKKSIFFLKKNLKIKSKFKYFENISLNTRFAKKHKNQILFGNIIQKQITTKFFLEIMQGF